MEFNMPKEQSSIIKVVGVGGGGSNAVNHMFEQGIKGVDFVVCNTDAQALDISPVPIKIQLGSSLTEGRGAGSIPDVGKNAAIENIDDIKEILANNTKMVFVTAGMGGGTGTGAAPVIAKTAKEMGVLTVGIVTVPFSFEGRKRKQQADLGIEEMRKAVDTLLIINNDRLREMFGNLTLANAFAQADQVLSTAAKGIAEVISVTGQINVDFNDVNTVMRDSGVAIMGSATAEGDNRAMRAVEEALASPLLNDNNIMGANYVLLNITYGSKEVLMDEISDITDYIQEEAGLDADVIWGHAYDEHLGEKLCITLIATGFKTMPDTGVTQEAPQKIKRSLNEEVSTNITAPVQSPMESSLPKAEAPVAPVITPVTQAPVAPQEPLVSPVEQVPVRPVDSVQQPPVEPVGQEPIQEEPTVQEQTSFSFDIAPEQPVAEEPVVPETPKEPEVTRYILEDDMENSALDTWMDSGVQQAPASPQDNWNASQQKEEPSEEWEPVLKPNEVPQEPQNSVPVHPVTPEPASPREEPVNEQSTVKPAWAPMEEPKAQQPVHPTQPKQVVPSERVDSEDQARLAEERIARIKQISQKLKTPTGLADLESEPAYKRRQIRLDDIDHSSERTTSRFSLTKETDEEGEGRTGLGGNNSFLHDNVD